MEQAIARAPRPLVTVTRKGSVTHTDIGSGRAMLALHGGMGGFDQSWLLGRALLDDAQGYRVIGVSRPGYPGTDLALGASPEEQADLYADLLDTLGIGRVHVAAVSAGGPSALQFALRHPDRCDGVILVSAATGRLAADHVLVRLRKMERMLRIPGAGFLLGVIAGRDPEASARRAISDPMLLERTLNDAEAGPLIRGLGTMASQRLRERMPGTMNDTLRYRDLPAIPFDRISVPLLALHGTVDRVVPFAHAEAAASVPGAKLVALEDGDHVALFTHLAQVRGAVADYLAP